MGSVEKVQKCFSTVPQNCFLTVPQKCFSSISKLSLRKTFKNVFSNQKSFLHLRTFSTVKDVFQKPIFYAKIFLTL